MNTNKIIDKVVYFWKIVKVVRKRRHENNKPRWLWIYHSVNDSNMSHGLNLYQMIYTFDTVRSIIPVVDGKGGNRL